MQTSTVTLPKASCLKMIELATGIETYYFNAQEWASKESLCKAIESWPGTEYDYHIEDGTTIVVASFQVVEVYRNERNDGGAAFLEFSYEVPGETMSTSQRIYYKEILPIAIELQLIDDYTFDYDVEVITNIEQGGYMSASGKGWIELPDVRRRMNFNDWLNNLDYEELTLIAQEYIKKNIAR